MRKNTLVIIIIYISAILLLIAEIYVYSDKNIQNAFYSAFSLASVLTAVKILNEYILEKRIKDTRSYYNLKKAISIIAALLLLTIIFRIWVENTESLLLSYGIIVAGIAIALQDIFKDFVGGISIIILSSFRVGDRIEINGITGDVIDIGIMNTTMMEISGPGKFDRISGKIVTVPNGLILSNTILNFTRDHNYVWDSIIVPITYDSDISLAEKLLLKAANKETEAISKKANEEFWNIGRKYYLPEKPTETSVMISLTDNWIEFEIRYICGVRSLTLTRNLISRDILRIVRENPNVKIAGESLSITGEHKIEIISEN
ncbi:mechanosensitive ion channel family protein [Methanoplanus limicola]|uniref:MscS Mechanosensitive ion channel n=1 Tax=Methanoplanus limicola DSM 2279 TaxID=937775 RepID=H1YYI9_9EURY|nr:mechanosensitive ion channel domain-containing protein [Methanoplanus limicola]EHQ35087.1 MscS Mechanosensitive ion channel [Methanoplanus limicola DSM 2279]